MNQDRVAEFQRQYLADRASGLARGIREYLELFPGPEDPILAAYATLKASASQTTLAGGGTTLGPYETVRELGRGGQGVVYLARDTRLHRNIALKVLTGMGSGSESSILRFRREAEVASRLDHPGICGVHDAGVIDGVPFIAMPFIDGESLAHLIASSRASTGPEEPASVMQWSESSGAAESGKASGTVIEAASQLPRRQVVRILELFERAARALHAAHEAGVLHRDIKPGNIMITRSDEPVILDFGLARADDIELQTITRTGDLFGTPAYMSPEQLTRGSIRLDRRSDVYSLGATLYESLTLRRPFEAPTREALYHVIMTKDPVPAHRFNPAIPRDVDLVLAMALEKDRDRRYQSAEVFADDLRAVREGRPTVARPVGPIGKLVRWSRREPAKALLLLTLLLALPAMAVLVTNHFANLPRIRAQRRAELDKLRDEHLSLGFHLLGHGEADHALRPFNDALAVDGSSLEAVAGIVLAEVGRNRCDLGLQVLDQHAELLRGTRIDQRLRRTCFLVLGRADEARLIGESLPEPIDALDWLLEGSTDYQLGISGSRAALVRALAAFNRAILLSPAPREFVFGMRVGAAAALGSEEVLRETEEALRKLWPRSPSSQVSRAFALGTLRRSDEALLACRAAIALKPDFASAHLGLADLLDERHESEESERALAAARKFAGDNSGIYAQIGGRLAKRGRLDEAEAAFRESLQHQPTLGVGHNGLGLVLLAKHRVADAILAFRDAIRVHPALVFAHQNLGSALVETERYGEAAESFERALAISPETVSIFFSLSHALEKAGRMPEAVAVLRRALVTHGSDGEAHHRLAEALRRQDFPDEAITEFREAARLNPGDPTLWVNFGATLARTQDFDGAVTAFEEAESLRPADTEIKIHLGSALHRCGRLEECILAFRAAVKLAPENSGAHHSLGLALRDDGRLAEAIASLRDAVKLRSEDAAAWSNLGFALKLDARYEDALTALRRAHELGSVRPGWSHPSAEWIAECQPLAAEERRSHALIESGNEPAEPRSLAVAATVLVARERPAQAARWFLKAFEGDGGVEKDPVLRTGFHAARAAALAGTATHTEDSSVTPLEKSAWKGKARVWLESYVDLIGSEFRRSRLPREQALLALRLVVRDPAFLPFQGEAAVTLDHEERGSWELLWAGVNASIDRLR